MSDNLGFLLADVARLMRRRFDAQTRDLGVTRPQWRVLTTLCRHEGINQVALADLLEVEPITLCRMIDRLQDAGFVERCPDPSDRRAWQLRLTDAAWPLIDDLHKIADIMFEEVMVGLDAPARASLHDALEQIRGNLLRGGSEEKVSANG